MSELAPPARLAGPVRLNGGKVAAESTFRSELTSRELADEVAEVAGGDPGSFTLSTRIFDFDVRPSDEVVVRTEDSRLPLIVRRNGELVVNFDIQATQKFEFPDSKRPLYTHVPGFHIHMVPEGFRRAVSNLMQARNAPKCSDVPGQYRRLPLTGFEFTILLLNTISARGSSSRHQAFRWPGGKRAAFVALHDVDTAGFLQRQESDPLFRVENKHNIRSTWFIPTAILKGREESIRFLLDSGHEAGWHGNKHDHRDHLKGYADRAVEALNNSRLSHASNFPTGMRLPKLLKSNYLFDLLDTTCPSLRYDTSFLHGIVPYPLWVNGKKSRILEIPTTVPTDIKLYNELRSMSPVRRAETMLKAQITRTEKLIEAGAVISIVTHPEKELSERPDFLDVHDQYLAYIRSRPEIWFTTAGELYKYWTGSSQETGVPGTSLSVESYSEGAVNA